MKRTLQKVSKSTSKGGLHRTTHTPMSQDVAESDKSKIEHAPTGATVHGAHGDIHVTTKAKRQVALANTYEKHRHGK